MHTSQPTIYGYGRNVHLWHFPWPKRPWPKCPGRNVLCRNVRGRNVLHSSAKCFFVLRHERLFKHKTFLCSLRFVKALTEKQLAMSHFPVSSSYLLQKFAEKVLVSVATLPDGTDKSCQNLASKAKCYSQFIC